MGMIIQKLFAVARELWADASGVMIPYVTMMLVVIVGVSVLALDGGRVMSLQTQLQKGADSLALAAAAELDRRPDAITRANAAINNLVTNKTLFAEGLDVNVRVLQVRFLSSIPASDASPISVSDVLCDTSCTPANAVNARFVEVTVQPITLPTILPATFIGGSAITAGAAAVAGNDGAVCKFIPMFICNPYETSGMTYEQATQALTSAAASPATRRRLIELKNDNSYGPGNYGFLNTPIGNGASELIEAIANVNPPVCLRQTGVDTQPGSINAVRVGFNVRFDMYDGSMNSKKSNSSYRPGQNVRKGYSGSGCGASETPGWPNDPSMGQLPRDTCFATSSCPYMGGRMGDGNWDYTTYWNNNHQGITMPTWTTTPPSRYEVYRYEVENFSRIADPNVTTGETGTPACYSGGSLSDTPDRRLLHVAIVNCRSARPGGIALERQSDQCASRFLRQVFPRASCSDRRRSIGEC